MDEVAEATVVCPRCSYRNPVDVHHCGMCGFVPPRVRDDDDGLAASEAQPGTAAFRRPSVEQVRQAGTAAIRKPTDRIAKPTTAIIAKPATGRIAKATTADQPPVTDRIARPTPPAGAPELPAEILDMRRAEQRKALKSTVYSTGRLIRYALVGVVALAAICVVREGAFTLTAFVTTFQGTDIAQVALFCLVFGLPIGFITAWHGGGAFRGLFVGGALFTVEPLLLGWFVGSGRLSAWGCQDLVAGLLAGFCVGLFIEIDR